MTLIIATTNAHKLKEYATLLEGVTLDSLADYPPMPPVEEDAPTFTGNAVKKALAAQRHTGGWVMADDSGIEVDALGGAPGVRSARYAPGSDADRCDALLRAMADEPNRRARFTCAIAIAGADLPDVLPAGLATIDGCVVAVGHFEGMLSRAPKGTSGFGYDPIFQLSDGRTVGELSAAEKHKISHRGEALRFMKPYIKTLFR